MNEDVRDLIDELEIDDEVNDVISDEESCHETELQNHQLLIVVLLVQQLLAPRVDVLLVVQVVPLLIFVAVFLAVLRFTLLLQRKGGSSCTHAADTACCLLLLLLSDGLYFLELIVAARFGLAFVLMFGSFVVEFVVLRGCCSFSLFFVIAVIIVFVFPVRASVVGFGFIDSTSMLCILIGIFLLVVLRFF